MSWIPVEERLPEVSKHYLVTVRTEYGDETSGSAFYYNSRKSQWGDGSWHVIAWQPLPEPYKKPRRFVVGRHLYEPDGYLIRDAVVESMTVCERIPTREAAETIADIYEEAYRGE